MILVGSLFELPYTSVVSVPQAHRRPFTAVVGYDVMPFTDSMSAFPPDWIPIMQERLQSLGRADLILAISDHSAGEIRRVLGQTCPDSPNDLGCAGGTRWPIPGHCLVSQVGCPLRGWWRGSEERGRDDRGLLDASI